MEEMPCGDTVPNTPERPMTPLEQMEEDDMRRLHPAFPSNAELIAAGEQYRINRGAAQDSHVTIGRNYIFIQCT